jgi:hypothetical protein
MKNTAQLPALIILSAFTFNLAVEAISPTLPKVGL